MNKKIFIITACLLCILVFYGCRANTIDTEKEATNPEVVDEEINNNQNGIDAKLQDITKIEIVYNIEPVFTTQDKNIINTITSMIKESKQYEYHESLRDRLSDKNARIVLYKKDGNKEEIIYKSDYLHEIGYIKIDNEKLTPKFSFFRYLDDLVHYDNHDTDIKDDVLTLFKKYNWTVDYKVNTFIKKLSNDLNHAGGEFPVKIYWAYNSELSKEIGLDYTKYLGEIVEVEIYRLRESLPEFLEPRRNARGIVLRYEGSIIGAYIDSGRHNSFACSLNRKSIEDITGKEWNYWIKDYIDYNNEIDIYLSKKEPEEIIREYFKALDNNDIRMVHACMTREALCNSLFSNMDNNKLYNEGFKESNVISAKLIEIKEYNVPSNKDNIKTYMIRVEYDFRKNITSEDGVQTRFVGLTKEVEELGWRIIGIGTGP